MLFRPLLEFLRRHGSRRSSTPFPLPRASGRYAVACERLEERTFLSANAFLVKDLNAQVPSSSSSPADFIDVNGTLFFTAITATEGRELWKSDGTAAGTVLVKDINPGPGFSFPSSLTNVNGTLYFAATDGSSGFELWKSDGTAAGTVQVQDIFVGVGSSLPNSLTNVNGTLYFAANDGVSGAELWTSDGTAGGTVLVRDIATGVAGSSLSSLTNVDGTLYFVADDGVTGSELWQSDGTVGGTLQVKDIFAGIESATPDYLTNVNGTLYFSANDGATGIELWKSDGTAGGTVQVDDIVKKESSSSPRSLTNVNGTLYFSAEEVVSGDPCNHDVLTGNRELWKSDGTTGGTVRVQDIRPGLASSYPNSLISINGTLYFSANNGLTGKELWKSDGTALGTELVKDISPGVNGAFPRLLTRVNDSLYFTANDLITGTEVWKSDGTEAGTVLIADLRDGFDGSQPSSLSKVNGGLLFAANDGIAGTELWRIIDFDLPTITTILPQVVDEGGSTGPLTYSLSDPNGNVNGLSVVATSSNISLIPNANIIVSGGGTNRSLSITPAAELSGLATITVTVSDGTVTISQRFQVRVQPIDDATIIALEPQPLVYQVSLRKAVAIDSSATLTDIDSPSLNFSDSVLQVSGQSAKDSLSVMKVNGIVRKGRKVFYGTTLIGSVGGGTKGAELKLHLNSNATKSSVQAFLRSVGFKSSDKSHGIRTMQLRITNSGGMITAEATRNIQVTSWQ